MGSLKEETRFLSFTRIIPPTGLAWWFSRCHFPFLPIIFQDTKLKERKGGERRNGGKTCDTSRYLSFRRMDCNLKTKHQDLFWRGIQAESCGSLLSFCGRDVPVQLHTWTDWASVKYSPKTREEHFTVPPFLLHHLCQHNIERSAVALSEQ